MVCKIHGIGSIGLFPPPPVLPNEPDGLAGDAGFVISGLTENTKSFLRTKSGV